MKKIYSLILLFISYCGFSQNIIEVYETNEDISGWSITGDDIEMLSREEFTEDGYPGCFSGGVGSINLQNTSSNGSFTLTSPSFSLTANLVYTLEFGYYYYEFDANGGQNALGTLSDVLLKDSLGNIVENLNISYNNPANPYQGVVNFQVNSTETYYLEFSGETDQVIVGLSDCIFCYFDDIFLYYNESLGIEKHNRSNEVLLYPNPTEGIVNLFVEKDTISKIRIYDIKGKLVLEPEVNTSIDISNLPTGVYFVNFFMENNTKNIVKKLIIK